jgi:hypothetical protein
MLKRILILTCAVLNLVVFVTISHAQLSQVSTGLNYLNSSQNTDGTWQTDTAQVETTAATVSVLETMKLLGQTGSTAYTNGISWLKAQSPQPVDYIAERLYALGLNDVSAIIPSADTTTGAWGGDAGYDINILDTALALQALKSANYTDSTILNPALAYLITNQNTNGGWGFYQGDDSNVYMTSVVSATLQQFPQTTTIATAVAKATSYLLAHQNTDGGFGSSPSTVYETGLAYVALAAVSANTTALGNAVNYLTATQSTDGSWNDDPYSTALALKALYLSENKPAPPPPPPAGGKITGTVVDSVTRQPLGGVAVALNSNPLSNATTDGTGSFTLNDVPAGSQWVSFTLNGYADKSASATVVVNAVAGLGTIPMVSSYSTGTIQGTVTDTTGNPVSGAIVTVGGAWSGGITTGDDGSFTFAFVTPGTVTITAAKAGYQSVTGSGTVSARTTLTFSPRLSTAPPQATTGTLVGRVVDSQWGLPIDHLPEDKGVTVTLSGGISTEPDPNKGGSFQIQGLAPNTYQVVVGMNGFASKTFRVVILPGVTTDLGTIRLEMSLSKMTLTGKVTNAASGAPISNAEIDVTGTQLTGVSDFAGTYAIADIPQPSQITLKVSAPGYIGKTFFVTTSPWTKTMDIALTPEATTGSLTGTVSNADTGKPLSGVTLTLAGNPAISATTGSTGAFTFTDLPKGAQQVNLALSGYAPRTLTTAIAAGVVNNVENIGLAVNQLPATIQGKVWRDVSNFPFAGVAVQASGTAPLQVVTAADGSYQLTDVPPGTVAVSTTAPSKLGYNSARFSGELLPGGILVFSPTLTATVPSDVAATVLTDQDTYKKSDSVRISVNLQNRLGVATAASLVVRAVDPTGATIFESSTAANLDAFGAAAQDFSFVLPASVMAGDYTVRAELYDSGGVIIGLGSKSFGVAVTQITVTPALPATFSTGANSVSFTLTNMGSIPVATGAFGVTLTDPNGMPVSTATQSLSLGLGESKTLTYSVTVPPLKIGTYTLSFLESDETTAGRATTIPLPNSITITPLFDSNSHRVRETANLSVTLANTGRFNLDNGVSATAAMPDAGYTETKPLAPAPAVGSAAGSVLLYSFVLPANMTAGQHGAKITVTLPSGSTQTQTAMLAIPESSLSFSFSQTAANAGDVLQSAITNSGGVDTQAQYRLRLYDSKSAVIADKSLTESVLANGTLSLSLPVPAGAMDGSYALVVNYTDVKTGVSENIQRSLTITGVKAALTAKTDKQTYLATETITALSNLADSGTALQGGNLHLQVVKAGGTQMQRTWTSQYDFQQGIRNGVDALEVPDSVRLMPYSDNFNDGILNSDRWIPYNSGGAPPQEIYGALREYLPLNPSYNWINDGVTSNFTIDGDFDVYVDYNITSQWNYSGNNHAANILVSNSNYWMYIDVWGYGGPTYGTIDKNGNWTNVSSGVALQGKLRIQRVGSSYFSYYWNGRGWTQLLSYGNRPVGPMTVTLDISGQGGGVETYFDNFTVATQTYPASGTLNLKYDSGRSDVWDNLSFNADTPAGTSIKFRTRTAETENGLTSATWSNYITISGSPITSPQGRWIEVEATLLTTTKMSTPTMYDLTVTQGHNAGDILWQTDVPIALAQGAVSNLNNTIGALGAAGKYYLQGSLTSGTGQPIASSECPFYVEQGTIQLLLAPDKKVYRPGETVTVTGEVRNLTSVATTAVGLQIQATGAGSGTLYNGTFDLAANDSQPFSFTMTAGIDGTYGLNGIVTQNAATLAAIADQYVTAIPAMTASLTGPNYAGLSPFTVTLTLNNTGKVPATTTVQLTDDGGSLADSQQITIPAGESRLLQYARQVNCDTTYTAVVSGDLNQLLTKKVGYSVSQAGNSATVSSKIVVDKVSYNPNQQASLTSSVSASSVQENLSAWITITDSQGRALYSDTTKLPLLNGGQTTTINKYWNTGTNPAGNYLVTLQVIDVTGTVISTSACNLVIASTTKPSALLKGQVSLDKQNILTGEPVTATYSVTNVGNVDLSGVSLSVRTVNMSEQSLYNTFGDQTTLAMGNTYTNSGRIDTQNYSAKDYLVVLQATIAGVEETLAGTYFRVEGAPSAPALSGPANGSDVVTFTPALTVSNASDPNDDELTYEFEVYADSGLTNLVVSGVVPEGAGSTPWACSSSLVENQTYFWRARAYDGQLYGPWMTPASFRVNTVNDPPTAPAISSPAQGTSVAVFTPVLAVDNASDPDSTNLTYNFDVALDPDFTQIIASVKGVTEGLGTTSWTVPVTLAENGWYYWRAQADDWLIEGPWSTVARFQVNTTNDAPSAPAILTPANNSTLTTLLAEIVAVNSTDPDSTGLIYTFEVDTATTFDSPNIIRSGSIAEGSGTTLWHVTGLKDNTRYYVRVKASDGIADSPWSSVVSFFANTVNDPPSVPTLANPSSGAGVTIFSPSLSIHNATDPDYDVLTYEFEVYADASMTNLVAHADNVAETAQITTWEVPVTLAENQTYYWRARAFDGSLHSDWMPAASFMVNTANDAPSGPKLSSPFEGSSIPVLTPTLAVANAVDPDSNKLTYDFEVYSGSFMVAAVSNVPQDDSGITSVTLSAPLNNDTLYQWRARAFDGDVYGPWMTMANFSVHLPKTNIGATINFDPDTLNKKDNGTWVTVYIELPAGYKPSDIDVSSIRLEGTIPAELRPYALGDYDKDGIPDLMVKFKRSDVIGLLPAGDNVPVHVVGKVGSITFEGVDVIRVIK